MNRDSIASLANLLPVEESLRALVTDAVAVLLSEVDVYRAEEQRLIAEFPKAPGLTRADRLRSATVRAAETAVIDAEDRDAHARRLVLVAVLGLFPGDLPLSGEFGAWQWRSTGHPFGMIVRYFGDRAPDYVAGRETALLTRFITDDESLAVDAWTRHLLEQLTGRLRQAGGYLGQRKTVGPAAAESSSGGQQVDDRQLAEHFAGKYGLSADRLRKAMNAGRIGGQRRGGRWFYSVAEVRKVWPDAFE